MKNLSGGLPTLPVRDRSRPLLALALLSVALLAVATYGGVLRYGFTGSDTLPLIASARVRSWGDVTRILTEPLMAGTSFVERGLFYRPVSILSFSLDEAVWGLDPVGYHLTDLALHVLVTMLVLMAVRRLREGRLGVAWLTAAIFTTHPILVESVPAISRRQDVLSALFVLVALLLHLRGLRAGLPSGRRRWTAAAVAAYLLALGAKEVAAVFPLVVIAHGTLFPADGGRWRVGRGLRQSVPYLAATAAALAWRVALLGRLGGIVDESFGAWQDVQAAVTATRTYLLDLVFPVDLLHVPPARLAQALAPAVGVAAAGLLALLAVRWRSLGRRWLAAEAGAWRILAGTAAAGGVLALAGLVAAAVAAPPSAAPLRGAARPWALGWSALALLLAASSLLLVAVKSRRWLRRWLVESEHGRWEAFFALWLPPFLLLFTFTHGLAHRSMYFSVIPFSALLALALKDGWRALRRAARPAAAGDAPRRLRLVPALRLALPALLCAYLLAFSPLVCSYPEWREAGWFSEVFFRRLDASLAGLPDDVQLHVHGLPSCFDARSRRTPHARSVSFLADYTIESWLDLHRPGRHGRVTTDRFTCPPRFEGDLDVTTWAAGPRDVHVEVRVEGSGG